MDWRDIPSLSALRAFEAAARSDSLTDAARTLNVTHAAISQHIRTLESDLGTTLMAREGRRMELTADGRRLAQALTEGFSLISDGISRLRAEKEQTPLRVALTASFAEHWLMLRLGGFWARHPDIELSLSPSPNLVDLRRDGYDVAIRYGRGDWPEYDVEKLAPANFVMVAAPVVAKTRRPDGTWPPGTRWFIEKQGSEHRKWSEAMRLIDETQQLTVYDTNQMVLSAVRAGYGVSVQPRAILSGYLEAGSMVAVDEQEDPTLGYYILTRKGPRSTRLQTFISWLHESA